MKLKIVKSYNTTTTRNIEIMRKQNTKLIIVIFQQTKKKAEKEKHKKQKKSQNKLKIHKKINKTKIQM